MQRLARDRSKSAIALMLCGPQNRANYLPFWDTFSAYVECAVFICLIKSLLWTINWNIFGHLATRAL